MSTQSTSQRVILASGGLVEKPSEGGPLVALIHRPRYRGEWNLPKGKLKEGESIWAAALREVREETNCATKIIGFVGITHYFHEQRPKFVVYWRMRCDQEFPFEPNDEVDQLEWLSPAEAKQKLTHPEEKQLVSEFYKARGRSGDT